MHNENCYLEGAMEVDYVPSSDCPLVCAVSVFLLKAVRTGWQGKPRSCNFKTFSYEIFLQHPVEVQCSKSLILFALCLERMHHNLS